MFFSFRFLCPLLEGDSVRLVPSIGVVATKLGAVPKCDFFRIVVRLFEAVKSFLLEVSFLVLTHFMFVGGYLYSV